MSPTLVHGRKLDPAPGQIALSDQELGPIPDQIATNPRAAMIDPRRWFAHPDRPFQIEIGTGKGAFLLQHAGDNPRINLLGIEAAREFYLYSADRCRRRELSNVRMLCADATEFLRWRCTDSVVAAIHLYFPDPWPKRKHHKKRIIQDRFLADVHRVLEPGGCLRIVTDHDQYWEWIARHIARWTAPSGWQMLAPRGDRPDTCLEAAPDPDHSPAVRASGADRPATGGGPFALIPFRPIVGANAGELVGTNFERKYRHQGRPFHTGVLVKQEAPPRRSRTDDSPKPRPPPGTGDIMDL